ncbi:DUF3244 domain-containing protein [Bacteroides sp. 51]|uniref:DUF3244 domain-containing protein n=1 Tax=Bacteroides sp. 51 TaxID=2302938 RepID=UPI0013D3512C|nr:DUF3244 domain-containing protein [Bacteroides sp. 51]NDV80546.1 DUF3244 domain-containing protein [Bacteroides sp. 51]
MRTKFLLLLSLFAFLAMDANSKQMETETTLREIQIKATARLSPRSMRTTSLTSSVQEIAPAVFLVGDAVAVNFASSTSNASIVVTNAETGEVVHHELFSCSAPTTVMIQLDGCEPGLYYVDITTTSTIYNGEFTL